MIGYRKEMHEFVGHGTIIQCPASIICAFYGKEFKYGRIENS